MELRERRMAQIVRDFSEAFILAGQVHERLRSDVLEFASVAYLVGDAEETALFRLKEECHALFRLEASRSRVELNAEELFDLAVGALFHETMKFRESYYLTTAYGPRLERMMAEGSASGPLAESFRRVFEAGHRRMIESESEVTELFGETRDQLLILLRQMPPSGAVARGLVEDPERSERVFDMALPELLAHIYGSAAEGVRLAFESLIENGRFADAQELLRHPGLGAEGFQGAGAFLDGMAAYYAGDSHAALEALSGWIEEGAEGVSEWRTAAVRVLEAIAGNVEQLEPGIEGDACAALETLRSLPSA